MTETQNMTPDANVQPIYAHGKLHPGDDHYPSAEVQFKLENWGAHHTPTTTMDTIMSNIRWDSMNGCWALYWRGIFIGIETDGYIHS